MQRDHAQVAQAQVHRHHRHADRGEELEHGRGQEGNAQHVQGAFAHALGGGGDAAQFVLAAAVQAQQAQALEPVGEMPAHPRQLAQLAATGGFGAPAHQHHEDRHQRRGAQQQQAHHPVAPADREQDQQRHHAHFQPRRLVAGVVAVQRVAVGQQQFAQFAVALAAQPQRAALQQAPVHAPAQFELRRIGDIAGGALRAGAEQRAHSQHQRQHRKSGQRLRQRATLHQQGLQQPGDGAGLHDQQRPGQADRGRGQPLPPARRRRQRRQPAHALLPQVRRLGRRCGGGLGGIGQNGLGAANGPPL